MRTGRKEAERRLAVLASISLGLYCLCGVALSANAQFRMVTKGGDADLQIARDLAKFVAPGADLQLEVITADGSAESLRRLVSDPTVKLATAQSDVYEAFLEQATLGNQGADELARPLRVVAPLHNEEIHFIVRADAPYDYVHQIRDAKINVGPPRSDTAVTASTLYRVMFNRPLKEPQASFLPHEQALVKLATDKTIDVVVIVAGQPTRLLANMKPEARQYIKLLKLDPKDAASGAALRAYLPATTYARSYPALLREDLPALAVKVYLVTQDFRDHETESRLIRFGRSLCHNISTLQTKGHPKWQEVELKQGQLARGWHYYQPTTTELYNCPGKRTTRPAPQPIKPE